MSEKFNPIGECTCSVTVRPRFEKCPSCKTKAQMTVVLAIEKIKEESKTLQKD